MMNTQKSLALALCMLLLLAGNVMAQAFKFNRGNKDNAYQPYPQAKFTDDVKRYPAATPPDGTVNRHGEIEFLDGDSFGIHWFVKPDDAVWHFVTAGNPASKETILLVHGYPETWHAFYKQMAALSKEYYVIAVDQLGYGQSDKNLNRNYAYSVTAASLKKLLDKIGLNQFYLVSHDRGTIISENLIAIDGMNKRIKSWVRMQQAFDEPHGYPRPPHEQMATVEFQGRKNLIKDFYRSNYVSVQLPEDEIDRLVWEFGFKGTPEAAALTFKTSFDAELAFRKEKVLPKLTMPVLLVQGILDPGQHAEEYMNSAEVIPYGTVKLIDTNHFMHLENPELVTEIIKDFFFR